MELAPAKDGATSLTARQPDFIRIENVSKAYSEGQHLRTILQDANVSFAKGEFVAIVGKSGSGKSTLLNLISGIDMCDRGTISLDGQSLTSLSDMERTLFRRHHIGFVFQFFNLIPTLTVWENVVLPLELSGPLSPEQRKHALNLLDAVGLVERLSNFPDRLSGGEQQRVAIARALVNDPILLLADEPTGNLDEETGRVVLSLLDQLARKSGKNVIMVTHSPEAAGYADRILNLRDHQLIEARDGQFG